MSLLVGIIGSKEVKDLAISFLESEGAVSYRITDGPKQVASVLTNSQYPSGGDIEERMSWRSRQHALTSDTQDALLEKIRTGMRVTVHSDVWIELALEKAAKSKIALITDMRFDNEILAMKSRGGILLRVGTPKHFLQYSLGSTDPRMFPDLAIEHSGTTEELEQKILSALELKVS